MNIILGKTINFPKLPLYCIALFVIFLIGVTNLASQVKATTFTPTLLGANTADSSQYPSSIAVQGNFAYITEDTIGANSLMIYNISNPASPSLAGANTIDSSNIPSSIAVNGNYAYITESGNSATNTLMIYNISNPASPYVVGTNSVDGSAFPTSIAVSGNYAYVTQEAAGAYSLMIYDISNPASPHVVGANPADASSSPSYVAISGHYAYVAEYATGANSLMVYDVSNPAAPYLYGANTADASNDPTSITILGHYAYVTEIATGANSLLIYDISNPASPHVVGANSADSSKNPSGLAISGKYAFVTENSNTGANTFMIYDISNLNSPTLVGANSSDSSKNAWGISVFGNKVYIAENGNTGANTLMIYDTSLLTSINEQINFQGKVVSSSTGYNVTDGTYPFVFGLYSASSGGSPIWTETQNVSTSNGIFQANLGAVTPLPGNLNFDSNSLWLGINFNNIGEMTPRIQLKSVPYAFNSTQVNGLHVTDTTGTLTIPNSTTVSFGGSFSTNSSNSLTLTTTGTTTLTLPTTGTLATLNGVEIFTNKTLTSFNAGSSNQLTINSSGNLATSGTITTSYSGLGAINLTGNNAGISFSSATSTNSTINTTAGNLVLKAASGVSTLIQIGTGGAGTTTPNLLALDVSSSGFGTGNPSGVNGEIYYNTASNVFRCYQASAWTNCISTGGSASWSAITNPSGNLALSTMNQYTTALTWNTTLGTNGSGNIFSLADSAGSGSGTGNLLALSTASGSVLKPFDITVNGGTQSLSVRANGQVGIGTSSTTQALTVAGNVANTALSGLYTPTILNPGGKALSSSNPYGGFVSGNYVYVADYNAKLWILDVSNPSTPSILNGTGTAVGTNPESVYVSGHYAYIADYSAKLYILDVSNPSAPTIVNTGGTAVGTNPVSVFVLGHYAYVADHAGKLYILDITNPASPSIVNGSGTTLASGIPTSVFVSGSYAYITDYNGSLFIYDISTPSAPLLKVITSASSMGNPSSVYVSGRYAYVADGIANMFIWDISNPSSPFIVNGTGTALTGANPRSIFVSGNYAYIADFNNHLWILDVSIPSSPVILKTGGLSVGTYLRAVFVSGRNAYIVDSVGYLFDIDISGIETTSILAHSLEAGNLMVDENAQVANSLKIGTGLNVGQDGIYSNGDIGSDSAIVTSKSATGSITLSGTNAGISFSSNTSTNSTISTIAGNLVLKPAGGVTKLLQIGTGGTTGTSTPNLLALDVKSSASGSSDPSGTIGEMYYNASLNAFRCYQNTAWTNCTGQLIPWNSITNPANNLSLSSMNQFTTAFTWNTTSGTNGSGKIFSLSDSAGSGSGTGNLLALSTASGSVLKPFDISVNGGTQALSVSSNGQVGIGTSSTSQALTVAGNVSALANSSFGPTYIGNSDGIHASGPQTIFVSGKYAYMGGGSNNDFVIYDISNPSNPTFIGASDTTHISGQNQPIYVFGKYAYILGGANNDLLIYDISNPSSPTFVGATDTTHISNGQGIFVSGKYAYVTSGNNNELIIYDVSKPSAPTLAAVSDSTHLSDPNSVFISGIYAYVTNWTANELMIYNISNPTNPTYVGTTDSTYLANPTSVIVVGKYAYIVGECNYITVYDISTPASPTFISVSDSTYISHTFSFQISGRYAIVASVNNSEVVVYDISNPSSLQFVGASDSSHLFNPYAIFVSGRYAYLADTNNQRMTIYDISGMETTSVIAHSSEAGTLMIDENAQVANSLNIGSSLNVGQSGIYSNGDISSNGLLVSSTLTTAAGNLTIDPSGASIVHIGTGGAGTATPNVFALDVKSSGSGSSDPTGANGDMYYNASLNAFRCYQNNIWFNCATTGLNKWSELVNPIANLSLSMSTNRTAYSWTTTLAADSTNNIFSLADTSGSGSGSGYLYTVSTGTSSVLKPLGITAGGTLALSVIANGTFGVGATPQFTVTAAGVVATSSTITTSSTTGADISLTAAGGAINCTNACALTTTAGTLSLKPAAGVTSPVQIGTGGTGTATPNLLELAVKSSAGDPAGANGEMYYNTSTGFFRCYQAGAWANCVSPTGTASWSAFTSPTANLALSTMSTYTTAFSWTTTAAADSTNKIFSLADTSGSGSGTGYLYALSTGSASVLKPFSITALGTLALSVNATGTFGIGSTSQFSVTSAGVVLTSGTITTSNTTASALSLTGNGGAINCTNACAFNTTTGTLSLKPAGGVTAVVQIGAGGTGSATPNILGLAVGSGGGTDQSGTNGELYYNNNTTAANQYGLNVNKVRCYENGQWQNCGQQDPYFPYTESGTWSTGGINTTTFKTTSNIPIPSVTGAPTASAQADNYFINYATGTTNGFAAGLFTAAASATYGQNRPKLSAVIRTGSVITSFREWLALTSATLVGVEASTASQANRYVGIEFSTSNTDTTHFLCASGDGTTSSYTSTGVVVAASTEYLLTVDWSVKGTLTCTVVKLSSPPVTTIVTKSTNLDAGATALYIEDTVTTLNGTAKNLGIALTQLEQN